MPTHQEQYQKISHNSIKGITKKLAYWKDKDNKVIKCSQGEEGYGWGWYRNYYYKGHSYFAHADFLLSQFGGSAYWSFSNVLNKEASIKKEISTNNDLESFYKKGCYLNYPNLQDILFNHKATMKLKRSLYAGGLVEMANMYDEIKAHLYHLSLEYLFKAVLMHSQDISFRDIKQVHSLLSLFKTWDKGLQKAIKNEFDVATQRHAKSMIQDDLIILLKDGGDREIGTNRYNEEANYPVRVARILQDLSEFFFLYLFTLKKVAGFDIEPIPKKMKNDILYWEWKKPNR